MKKERQIGVRVGLPAFFALEVEVVYRHTQGAHRALAFPDFLGLLIGLGLEEYRKGNAPEPEQGEGRDAALCLFDTDRRSLPDLFKEFDEAMKAPCFRPVSGRPFCCFQGNMQCQGYRAAASSFTAS
jgi:hypothetical protein